MYYDSIADEIRDLPSDLKIGPVEIDMGKYKQKRDNNFNLTFVQVKTN